MLSPECLREIFNGAFLVMFAFIILKFMGVAQFSWWWVFSPVPLTFIAVSLGVMIAGVLSVFIKK